MHTSENFEFDTINIVGTVINAFNIIVFIPLIIYGVYLFHKHRANPLIFHRNPFAVFLMNALVITALLTERTFILFTLIYGMFDVPSWCIHLAFSLSWDAVIYLKLVKVYYVYFQQRYNLSIASKAWKQSINPQDDSDDALWYISHKNTYGNIQYLMKLASIPWITAIIFDTLIPLLMGDIWLIDVFHLLVALLPITVSFGILYKTRLVNDIFRIRNELFIAVSCIGISFIGYGIMFMYRHLLEYHIDDYGFAHDKNRLESLVYTFMIDGLAFACSILSTMYPVYLIQKCDKEMAIKLVDAQMYCGDLYSLNEILSRYKLFVPFMTYLVSEWCPENLLFLTELIQIKYEFQKRLNYIVPLKHHKMTVDFNVNPAAATFKFKTETEKHFTYLFHETGAIFTKLSLSPKVICSQILTKEENENNLYRQMNDLYEKYVKRESEYELNISYEIRDKLKQQFEDNSKDYQEYEVFNVMDECAIAIVKLLLYSISRFVDSDEFGSISDVELEPIKNPRDGQRLNDAAFTDLLNAEKTRIIIA